MKAIEDRLLRSKLSFLFSLSSHSLIKEKERKKELHEDAHKRKGNVFSFDHECISFLIISASSVLFSSFSLENERKLLDPGQEINDPA